MCLELHSGSLTRGYLDLALLPALPYSPVRDLFDASNRVDWITCGVGGKRCVLVKVQLAYGRFFLGVMSWDHETVLERRRHLSARFFYCILMSKGVLVWRCARLMSSTLQGFLVLGLSARAGVLRASRCVPAHHHYPAPSLWDACCSCALVVVGLPARELETTASTFAGFQGSTLVASPLGVPSCGHVYLCLCALQCDTWVLHCYWGQASTDA